MFVQGASMLQRPHAAHGTREFVRGSMAAMPFAPGVLVTLLPTSSPLHGSLFWRSFPEPVCHGVYIGVLQPPCHQSLQMYAPEMQW